MREMGEERKKKKVWCDHVREKGETKLVKELMSEYYLSKLVRIFTHENFLVKLVKLLEVVF
jgi:hypothetical protein